MSCQPSGRHIFLLLQSLRTVAKSNIMSEHVLMTSYRPVTCPSPMSNTQLPPRSRDVNDHHAPNDSDSCYWTVADSSFWGYIQTSRTLTIKRLLQIKSSSSSSLCHTYSAQVYRWNQAIAQYTRTLVRYNGITKYTRYKICADNLPLIWFSYSK